MNLLFLIVTIVGATIKDTKTTSWNLDIKMSETNISTSVDDLSNHLLAVGEVSFDTSAAIGSVGTGHEGSQITISSKEWLVGVACVSQVGSSSGWSWVTTSSADTGTISANAVGSTLITVLHRALSECSLQVGGPRASGFAAIPVTSKGTLHSGRW